MSRPDSVPTDALASDGLLAPRLLAAAEPRVAAHLAPTPLLASASRGAWLKLENLQVTGAYKVRGALNALMAAVERGDRRPVIAASAGNHGLGVAWAARKLGLAATVVVPADAPLTKVRGCHELGAEVLRVAGGFEACVVVANAQAEATGARFVHAFDDAEVIAGQGTIGAEILAARPDVVVVPIGGAGLVAGLGSALRRAGVRVVGVQVVGVDAFSRALAGRPARPPAETIADGLRVAAAGTLSGRIAAAALHEIVLVEEKQVSAAVASLASDDKLVVEGAGAVAVAALPLVKGARRVAIVSGGNIDPERFAALTARAL